MPRTSRRTLFRTLLLTGALASLLLALPAKAAPTGSSPGDPEIVAADYDLGVRRFVQPLSGKVRLMPIRLWGTIAAPAAPGRYPVVVVFHGAHGDNCPEVQDVSTWPCWTQERRSDLGFRYLVQALARAGFVAVSLDVNGAFTGGWGEFLGKEKLRFRQAADATLRELANANRSAGSPFGISLTGKLKLGTIGALGHSRGGMNAFRWAGARQNATSKAQIRSGQGRVRSLFLLAPAEKEKSRIADVPLTVAMGTCDADTGSAGSGYYESATRAQGRDAPAFELVLTGANHEGYNQTLVELDIGQSTCPVEGTLSGAQQQAWLEQVAVDHFRATLLGGAAPTWMVAGGPSSGTLYGHAVSVTGFAP